MFRLSIGTYFMGGFVVSLVSLLVLRLKLLMGLDYAQSSLVQFSFHSSYLLFALPITAVLVGIGYMRGLATGLLVMALGCIGFTAAAALHSYPAVLLALLTLAGGVTFLQIAASVVVAVVEPQQRAIPRMTLLQGFNSIGTVLAPLVGAWFFFGDAAVESRAHAWGMLELPFLAGAVVLLALAVAFWAHRNLLAGMPPPRRVKLAELRLVLADPKLVAGSLAMFAYVGAEVTIGGLLASYLVSPQILSVAPVVAGRLVSLYWAGAMLGRFAGAAVLTRVAPPRLLAVAAVAAMVLVLVATRAEGVAGAAALIAVGLCNSIMYPTLFALSLPEDQSVAPYASMALCMTVVGGAVVPLLTGWLADRVGLAPSLLLPGLCYLGIAIFALACTRRWADPGAVPT
ncbi:MFS transporter [Sphingomonas sp. TREG-RG-20F-R18-01]|uniref:MFS transporter n=1 Tax=Sphingomonas sp. TREG-RG-20F-R18-01 TaxID=2914982 RepID=UPI001F578532|nr:MFS transporter [Sphingomonas sp. TREG-RG-20F-R18-01]